MAELRLACPPLAGAGGLIRLDFLSLPGACCSETSSQSLGGGERGDEIYSFRKMELKTFNFES